MAKAALVEDDIRNGLTLVGLLDEEQLTPTAAFWLYLPDDDIWRLLIALPSVYNEDAGRAAYSALIPLLDHVDEVGRGLTVDDIALVPPNFPAIRVLSKIVQTGPNELAGLRLTGNAVGNVSIDDAYVYRMFDPLAERESALKEMLAGKWPGITSESAVEGLARAEEDLTHDGFARRSLGFGLIAPRPKYEGGDWQEFLLAVTDGERSAAVVARISGTQLAVLEARGEDVVAHLIERLRRLAGSIPRTEDRYAALVLAQPLTFHA